MKLASCFLAAFLVTTPVMAWELDGTETKKTWSYVAFQADKAGSIELQFYCDESYPDDIQMLVFTNMDSDATDDDHPSVAVKAIVDDETFDNLSGYYDAVDGERTLVIDTVEEDRVRDVIAAARNAKKPLQVYYDGHSNRFAVDDIAETLGDFIEGCDRS